jgi:hypothetical protein
MAGLLFCSLLPVGLLAAVWADVPFVPVNYRADEEEMNPLIARQVGAHVLGLWG